MTQPPHPAFAHLPPIHPHCRLIITIPARNEEATLPATLHALARQCTGNGRPFPHTRFEILLLLNHCTDGSAAVATRFQAHHPTLALHIATHNFPTRHAHVGSARSLLLQQAARRFSANIHGTRLLLTTDADTVPTPHWLAHTLSAVHQGAEAVGGDILTRTAARRHLTPRTRLAYVLDRRYGTGISRLESLLDPLHHDPWPRHHHHFGASLACTLEAYHRAGGMAPITPLEDLAFYHALLRADIRFRHDPRVQVHTSTRTDGRAPVGLSFQLRRWQDRDTWLVPSAHFHATRARTRAHLRRALRQTFQPHHHLAQVAAALVLPSPALHDALSAAPHLEALWQDLQGDERIAAALPSHHREGPLPRELRRIQQLIQQQLIQQQHHSAATHPSDTSPVAALQQLATMAG